MDQRPLELILARNFLTSLSTPAFLVDEKGGIIFYNEAAGGMLGISFEEFGQKPPEEWGPAIGPFPGLDVRRDFGWTRAVWAPSRSTHMRNPQPCCALAVFAFGSSSTAGTASA